MINNSKVIAIIPARGGSKGIPRKNMQIVSGKPLIAYTIEAAKSCEYIDEVVVSSEDSEILKFASSLGVQSIERPMHLAKDESSSIDSVLHALTLFEGFSIVVLLQPTSPLRSVGDISDSLKIFANSNTQSCISLVETKISPLRSFQILPDGRLRRMVDTETPIRRQDAPTFYAANGAIYIADSAWLKKSKKLISEFTIGYVMPAIRSLDIDVEYEIDFCEFLINKYGLIEIEKK
jgi:N-acylneuraminate cytidylyltransferase